MSSSRRSDFGIVAAIFVFAVLVSPIGIRFGTGRLDLSPRVNILSLTFDLFLMTLAGAVLTSGRARRVFFHLLVWTIPLALFAVIEVGAIAIHLADESHHSRICRSSSTRTIGRRI